MQQPPTHGAGGATSELRSDAQQITSKAADRLHNEVEARKGNAAQQVKSVSNAIQTAGAQLDESAPSWLKSAFQQGADQIQRFANTIEQKDSRQIQDELQSFARERPALFLGACAAAGFAAARIFKAGGEQQASQEFGASGRAEQDQPWGDGQKTFRHQQLGQAQSDQQLGEPGRPTFGSGTGTQANAGGEFV